MKAMKKRRKQNYAPVRYYDIRLIWMHLCLFAFYVALNTTVGITFNTPVIAEWIEVRPGAWSLSNEIHGLLNIRISLCFFELSLGCFILWRSGRNQRKLCWRVGFLSDGTSGDRKFCVQPLDLDCLLFCNDLIWMDIGKENRICAPN